MKESFIFYRSFYEASKSLSNEDKYILYDAIISYSFDEINVKLEGFLYSLFALIKPQLDANKARYENGKKGKKFGKLGGKKKHTPMGLKQDTPMGLNSDTPNKNVNVNVNVNENKNDNVNGIALRLSEFIFSLADMQSLKNTPIGETIPDAFMHEAMAKAVPTDEIWKQWEKFTNYFQSADAKKPLKKDWIAAWRNWIVK
jgi:hypothetical protein